VKLERRSGALRRGRAGAAESKRTGHGGGGSGLGDSRGEIIQASRAGQAVTMMEGPQMQQGHDFLRAPPAPPASAPAAAAPAEFGRANVIFDGAFCSRDCSLF
jgi:hypothetical protein